jgi:hypothetical protein
MVTIPLKVSDELAVRLIPLQDRLADIIEMGLRQMEVKASVETETEQSTLKPRVLAALLSTGLVSLPRLDARPRSRLRHTPILAGGQPASEIIIEQRHGQL